MQEYYSLAVDKACAVILATQRELPIDPFKTIKRNGWGLFGYSFFMDKHNCSLKDICETFGSEDAAVLKTDNSFMIVYNDFKSQSEVRFNLAHEIGHIKLDHLTSTGATKLYFDRNTIIYPDDPQHTDYIEKEANVFAANFLAPAPLLETYNLSSVDVENVFAISSESAVYRLQTAKSEAQCISEQVKGIIKETFRDALLGRIFLNYN